MLNQQLTLNCAGKILDLSQPQIMGVLNVTPDSFYDGGQYINESTIISQTEKMISDGASIIDIGGMSSRPGAAIITVEEELKRVVSNVALLKNKFPETIFSIDTVHSEVARQCVEAGAGIVNDISAGKLDATFYKTVADLNVPYVLMHMKGTPKTMQKNINYQDVLVEVLDFFIKEIGKLRALGLKDVIIDPGFGFGKTIEHNFHLLKNMHAFKILDVPMLVGISRKSMVYKSLDITAKEALNGTTALHMIALQQGAKILRVHDVKEAAETIKLWKILESV